MFYPGFKYDALAVLFLIVCLYLRIYVIGV